MVRAGKEVVCHDRPGCASVAVAQGLEQCRVLVPGRGDLALDRGVEAVGKLFGDRAQQKCQSVGPGGEVDLAVEAVAKGGDEVLVAGRARVLELGGDLREDAELSGSDVLCGPGRQLPAELGLGPEQISYVLTSERRDDESPSRYELHEALAAQSEQPFANRRVADPDGFRNRLQS